MENLIKLTIKWSGKEYDIELTENDTVEDLRNAIHKETRVHPNRQKLLNLKYKGKTPEDNSKLCLLKLKPGFKVMMMGSLEEDIAEVRSTPEDMPEVVNDLEILEEEVAIEKQEVYLAKIEKRINSYDFKMFNSPREGKKLLVLDIDYTLFDHRSTAESGAELMRPYLHEFLTSAYEDYDIVIWSATSMKWIEEKMKLLGVANNDNYKILFYLDNLAMITVHTTKYGVVNVKPLGVIWGKFKEYSSKNTIMFDDIRRNFIMNPKNGLKIRPFSNAHTNRATDRELLKLKDYLQNLAVNCTDFTSVDHSKWDKKKSSSHRRSHTKD